MAIMKMPAVGADGGGSSKYYATVKTPNTSTYTNVPCDFVPKYVIAYRCTTDAKVVANYWNIEADTFVTTTNGDFEIDNKASWVPAYFKIGSDGKSIDFKAPNSYYASQTRIIMVG